MIDQVPQEVLDEFDASLEADVAAWADGIERFVAKSRDHALHAWVDYAGIARTLDFFEARALADLRDAITECQDLLTAQVRRSFDPAKTSQRWVAALRLRKFGPVRERLQRLLQDATEQGGADMSREVPRGRVAQTFAAKPTSTPRAAVKAMRDKAFWVSGVLEDQLTHAAQAILVQAIKGGEALDETVRKLEEAWLPYLGDETVIVDQQQLQPYRLETIVRTNTTDAYNTGRLAQIRDPDLAEWVQGVRYSAIMDERTTELCRGLDSKVFRIDDPDVDRLTPPNHFNCRSIWVSVLIDEEVDVEDFVTQRDIGTALDRMGAGFGGVAKYHQPKEGSK